MLNGQGRKYGIHDKRAGGLTVLHRAAQNIPVPFSGIEYSHVWLAQPTRNGAAGFESGMRAIEHPRIGRNSQECP